MLLPLFRSLCFCYCIAHGVISVRACFVDCCLLNKVSFLIEHFIYLRHSRCDKLIMINLKKGTRILMEKAQQWLDRSVNHAPDSLNCLKIPTIINHQIFLRAYDWSKGISRSNKTNKNKIINKFKKLENIRGYASTDICQFSNLTFITIKAFVLWNSVLAILFRNKSHVRLLTKLFITRAHWKDSIPHSKQ